MIVPAAFITGAGRGIGKAIALALAGEGYNVALNGLPGDADLAVTVGEVRSLGVHATEVPGDVSNVDGHPALLDAAEAAIGPLTTLVNNAGVSVASRGDLLDVSVASYDRCLAINARAVFFLSQAFARRLIERERNSELHYSIINISSANAVAPAANRAEYSVSKAAVSTITMCFAARLGPENVNVYEIQPGIIETDMTAASLSQYQRRIDQGFTLTRRIGTPGDVGAAAAALATGRFKYSTGQVVRIDGGLLVPRF